MQKPIVHRLVDFAIRHSTSVILVTVVATAVFAYFALNIQVNAKIADLVPQDVRVMQLLEKYSPNETLEEYLFIAVEPTDGPLFTLENMQALDTAIQRIEQHPQVHGSTNPFNLMTFQKQGAQLHVVPMSYGRRAPQTATELDHFQQRLVRDRLARNMVISYDLSALGVVFRTDYLDDYSELLRSVKEILADLRGLFTVYIGGYIPFDAATKGYLLRDVPTFLILAIAVILIIYFVGFRTRRAVLLPLLIVIFGTIWTAGAMRMLGLELSIVSIMTPPLVLTLGGSYSMHILNQYYREARTDAADRGWIADAVAHINRTILLAAITTVIGFGSLVSATLRQIREFGVSTSLGIIFCACLALFFFPAVLSRLSSPTLAQRERVTRGSLTAFLERLGSFIVRRRIFVLLLLVAITIGFSLSVQNVRYETDYTSFYRRQEAAVDDNAYIAQKFGGFYFINLSLTAPENAPRYFLNPSILEQISSFESSLQTDPDVVYIASFVTYLQVINKAMTGRDEIPKNRALIGLVERYFRALSSVASGGGSAVALANSDFSQLTITMKVFDSEKRALVFEEELKKIVGRIQALAESELDPEMNPELWGGSLAALYLSETLTRDQLISVIASSVLIFLVTAFAFRSPLYGLLSLVPMLSGIFLNFIFMTLLNIPLDVVTVMFSSVAIGVGVDSSIHLLIQYRKQKALYGDDTRQIVCQTLATSGRAILLTSLSLVAGLLVLVFSSFMPIVYFGILVSFVLFTTAIGSLVFLPALLTLDRRLR